MTKRDKLPEVAGRVCTTSLAAFERSCLVHIGLEQAKVAPDNGLIATLCDAVRLAREYGDSKGVMTREELKDLSAEAAGSRHGVDCPKALHVSDDGYLHSVFDDGPYSVDGLMYCGRCHVWIAEAQRGPKAVRDTRRKARKR